MSASIRSPRRKSLADHNMNVSSSTLVEPALPHQVKENTTVAFSLGREGKMGSLSPGKMARRSALTWQRPRKSILKGIAGYSNEDNTIDFTRSTTLVDSNHTIAFGDLHSRRASVAAVAARRVSFAANAHVRMFNDPKDKEKEQLRPKSASIRRHSSNASSLPAYRTGRRSSQQSRQSSVHTVQFPTVDDAEVSMDLEDPDDEASGVEMGDRRVSTGSAQSEEEEDEEVDMDETGVYGAGIIRRESTATAFAAADENDMSFASSTGTDEEKTMDFTIAIGGIVPPVPPVHATRNRQSIGYSQPESPNSLENRLRPGQAVAGEADMSIEMDETVAYGGIVGDESFSSGSDGNTAEHGRDRERTMTFSFGNVPAEAAVEVVPVDEEDDGMDMTVALGGIVDVTAASPARFSLTASASLTRPSPGTSSYARPTVSSAQRTREPTPKKRNIFGPSPGSQTASTPRSEGMATAGAVAKRLSFGSVTSSGGKKRPAEEDVEEGSAKRPRPTITKNIFAPDAHADEGVIVETISSNQRRSASASPVKSATAAVPAESLSVKPRQSIPRNLRPPRSPGGNLSYNSAFSPHKNAQRAFASPARTAHQSLGGSSTPQQYRQRFLGGSPAKSPHVRRLLGEDVPQEEIDLANEEILELEPPMINLSDFLRMAKVEFLEDLPKAKRRSSTGRGVRPTYNGGDRQFALGEYAEAEINALFLTFYTWANRETTNDLEASRADLEELERARSLHNPLVIRHYLAATDEEKVLFEDTFKAFKTNTSLKAKERWYEWKHQIIERLRPDVEALLEDMQEDAQRLDDLESRTSELLPELQSRLESLEQELEKERAAVQEVAECDQDYLAGLRIDLEEQGKHIDQVKSELEDSNAKLTGLQTKLDELDKSKKICEGRISAAKSMCDQYTRSDILRFKEEYESVQALHSWRVIALTTSEVVLSYDNQIQLVVPCQDHTPNLAESTIEWIANPIKGKYKHGMEINEGLFAMLQTAFSRIIKSTTSLVELVQQTGSIVNASQRLRAEMGFLTMRLPTSYRSVDTPRGKGIIITAAILLRSLKSKVNLCFLVTADTLLSWPGALANVEVESKAVYGSADPEIMRRAARETIMETSDEGYVGAFLQACLDAQGQHER